MKGRCAKKIKEISGFGSVHGVPLLPDGFNKIFKSYMVYTETVCLHVVEGGHGPALLLIAGWPQCWYAWRNIMIPLSRHFRVIAMDPRGVGLSEKPTHGYDAGTLGEDVIALMNALEFREFSIIGHDTGMWTAYLVASDHPDRVRRVALGEAIIPGVSESPPLLLKDQRMNDLLWHFNFNRAAAVNERLVEGREWIYFGYQFESKAASPDSFPDYAKGFYIELLRRIPGALKASFEVYRSLDVSMGQYHKRSMSTITMPVLAFSGEFSCGDMVEKQIMTVASNVSSVIIPDCGHYPAEEKPKEILKALQDFLY